MSEYGNELLEQLFHILGLLHRYKLQLLRRHGPFSDPHRGQGRVLSILRLKPDISQKELSFLLNIRNQSLGELLTKLEKVGFITRSPSETDRRVMMVHLTESGEQASNDSASAEPAGFFNCLDSEEQQTLLDYLTRIGASLEQTCSEGEEPEGHPGGFHGFTDGRMPAFEHGHGRLSPEDLHRLLHREAECRPQATDAQPAGPRGKPKK